MKSLNSNYRIRDYIILTVGILLSFSNAHSTVINITAQDFLFTPTNVNAFTGDTIKWTWIGSRDHTTTCDGIFSGTSLPSGADTWDAALNSGNPAFEYVLRIAGTYNYACRFHAPGMSGTIVAETPLPVELTEFVATTIKNEVILDWSTIFEYNNDKFEIQRINVNDIKGNDNINDYPFFTIGVLRGYGNSDQGHHYSFTDRNLKSGKYLYRLKQVDFNSNFIYHLLNEYVVIGVPSKFSISQNYPNPFNPTTKINYELPNDGFVKVTLFDNSGKEILTLINGYQTSGYQTAEINGTMLSSGVYFYRIDFNSNGKLISYTKKMMLVK